MRFVTYAESDGDRAAVLDGDQIHAMPRGTRLIDLIGEPDRLLEAGERTLQDPETVRSLSQVRVRAPIPKPRQYGTS